MDGEERDASKTTISQRDRHGRLVEELDSLRKRGIERIDSRGRVRSELPELDRLLAASHVGDGVERPAAMRALIELALTYCQNADALATLYGDVSDFTGNSPGGLYKEAAEAAGVFGEKSIQRWVASQREVLARALIQLEAAGFAPGSEPVTVRARSRPALAPLPPLPECFVERPTAMAWLRHTYADLAANRGGRFCLTGIAGSGKTVMALWLASTFERARDVACIRLHQRGIYEDDLGRTLQVLGGGGEILPASQAEAHIRNLLNRGDAPKLRLLILDGVRTAEDVRSLVPPTSNVPMLITSRETGALAGSEAVPTLALDGMNERTSRELLGPALERLSETDAKVLVDQLRGHPASLVLARRALSQAQDVDIIELLSGLQLGTGQTLDDLDLLFGGSGGLRHLVREQVGALSAHPATRDLLACLAWGSGAGEMTVTMLRTVHGQLVGRPMGEMAYRAAFTRLDNSSLIHGDVRHTRVWMTPLMHQLVREALADIAEPVLLALEELARMPREPEPTDATLDVLRHDYALLEGLPMFRNVPADGDEGQPRLMLVGYGPEGQSTWSWFWTVDEERHAVPLLLGYPESLMLWPGDSEWQPLDPKLNGLIGSILPQFHAALLAEAAREAEDS